MQQRIGNVTAGAIIGIALIIDGLQFLLTLTVVGSVIAAAMTFLAGFGFWLWFSILGVKYVGKDGSKKLLIGITSLITELIPVVDALPATTLGVVLIIIQTRIEDARTNAGKKVTQRTALAAARAQKMQAARAQRADTARADREAAQQERHAPANDNDAPGGMREAA